MSGGFFDYNQFKLDYIADDIENLIKKNGKKKTEKEIKNEGWRDPDWYKKYPEDLYHYKYPDEIIKKFKEGLDIIRKARIYAHRIDYLISGDDGEDSFLERLKKDLNDLNKEKQL